VFFLNEDGVMESGWSKPKTFRHKITGEIKDELGIFDNSEEFEEIKGNEATQVQRLQEVV